MTWAMRSSGWNASRLATCWPAPSAAPRQFVGLGPVDPALGVVKNRIQSWVEHTKKWRTMSSCLSAAPEPLAAALLAAVQVGLGALGVAGFGDRDDDVLAGDQILVGDLALGADDPGPTVIAVFFGRSRRVRRAR